MKKIQIELEIRDDGYYIPCFKLAKTLNMSPIRIAELFTHGTNEKGYFKISKEMK